MVFFNIKLWEKRMFTMSTTTIDLMHLYKTLCNHEINNNHSNGNIDKRMNEWMENEPRWRMQRGLVHLLHLLSEYFLWSSFMVNLVCLREFGFGPLWVSGSLECYSLTSIFTHSSFNLMRFRVWSFLSCMQNMLEGKRNRAYMHIHLPPYCL